MSRQRWVLLAGTAALVAGFGISRAGAGSSPAAPTLAAPTVVVEATSAVNPSLSGDGRYVAYAGAPATDDGRTSTVWLRDRTDESVVELTTPRPDIRIGDSVMPSISADGCVVAVVTEMAYDLFRDDDGGSRWDVYIQRLPACGGTLGDWELVSTSSSAGFDALATDSASPTAPPAVSGAGSVIAYVSRFSAAAPGITGITVVDLTVPVGQPGRSTPVAGTPTGAPPADFKYRGLRDPSISDDGSLVAYTSDANSDLLTRDWAPAAGLGQQAPSQVFVWDRDNTDPSTTVRRVSVLPGSTAGGEGSSPALSGDGQFIAFVSTSTDLVVDVAWPPCATTCPPQVYRYSVADGGVVLVSATGGGESGVVAADHGATQPSITFDGSDVVFVTRSTNLFEVRSAQGDAVDEGDIVVSHVESGSLERLSVLPDGVTPAPAVQSHPHLSSNGRVVVFDTQAGPAFSPGSAPGRQIVAVTQEPVLVLDDLDVGTVAVGYPGPEWFVPLINKGPSAFVPATVESSNPDFLVSGGTCETGAPVPPGGTCTVNIMLTPSVAGRIEGTLTIAEAGFEPISITAGLHGQGGEPTFAATPAGAKLGSVQVGTTGEPTIFEVMNVGWTPIAPSKVTIIGANAKDFAVKSNGCRSVLDVGLSCKLGVVFSPSGAGRRTATVVVSAADGQYTTILLAGDGFYTPQLAVGAASVAAGGDLGVSGSGFAPNTAVTLMWADGSGRTTTATTNEAGQFQVTMRIASGERSGTRTLVGQTASGDSAAVAVTITRGVTGRTPGSPTWPGR